MNKINTINGILMASLDELNEHVENGTAHVTEEERTVWNTQASVNAKGIVIATQGDLDEHAGNKAIHLTEEERTAWNAKADASALSGKVNTAAFNAHKSDAVAHVTAEDRQRWDAAGGSGSFQTLDVEGNGTFGGSVTMEKSLTINGACSAGAFQFGPNTISFDSSDPMVVTTTGSWRFSEATFTGGVTMGQSLNVAGKTIANGGMTLAEDLYHNGSVCVTWKHTPTSNDYIYINTDTGGVQMEIHRDGFHMMSSDPDPYEVLTVREMDARYGRINSSNTWDGDQTMAQSLNVIGELTAVNNTTHLGNVITANMSIQRMDVHGPASFSWGVTMAQDLNIARNVTIGHYLDLYNSLSFKQVYGGYIQAEYDSIIFAGGGASGGSELTVQFEDGNNITNCNIRKRDALPESIDDESVLNRKEGDERWVKFDNALTDAEYAALAVKDETTLYITDTGKIYLGSYALN